MAILGKASVGSCNSESESGGSSSGHLKARETANEKISGQVKLLRKFEKLRKKLRECAFGHGSELNLA